MSDDVREVFLHAVERIGRVHEEREYDCRGDGQAPQLKERPKSEER